MAAPFERAFDQFAELQEEASKFTSESAPEGVREGGTVMAIHYREEEAIYIKASHDRVTVIFSTIFREETDRIFGKIFLQVWMSIAAAELEISLRDCYANADIKVHVLRSLLMLEGVRFRTPLRCCSAVIHLWSCRMCLDSMIRARERSVMSHLVRTILSTKTMLCLLCH